MMNVLAHCTGCDDTHMLEERRDVNGHNVCPECGDVLFEMEVPNTREQTARARLYNVLIDVDSVTASAAGAIAAEHTTLVGVTNSTIGRLQEIDGVTDRQALEILDALQ